MASLLFVGTTLSSLSLRHCVTVSRSSVACLQSGSVLRFITLALAFLWAASSASAACTYPAIFSFGNSLTDTGNAAQNFIFNRTISPPYGETYFGRPAKRYSDGRLVIDFLAQAVGLPFLNGYLEYRRADGTDFTKGINYAVAGATVLPPIKLITIPDVAFLSVDNLGVQLRWHLQVKQAVDSPSPNSPYQGSILPPPNAFSEGLYFIDLGGNDYGSFFLSQLILPNKIGKPVNNSVAISTLVPKVVQHLLNAAETLYANGARNVLFLSVSPIGCSPLFLRYVTGPKDQYGCLTVIDDTDAAHNQRLLAGIEALRSKYADFNLMYADTYGAYLKLLSNPAALGITETLRTCCGLSSQPYGFSLTQVCGPKSAVCPDPSKYVIWDGVHNTERTNQIFTNFVTSGEFLNPSNGLACASQV